MMLYIFTIKGLESYLYNHFNRVADRAITITDFDQPVATKIQNQVRRYISGSKWVTLGGVEGNGHVARGIGQEGGLPACCWLAHWEKAKGPIGLLIEILRGRGILGLLCVQFA